jgi:hypothetical protein
MTARPRWLSAGELNAVERRWWNVRFVMNPIRRVRIWAASGEHGDPDRESGYRERAVRGPDSGRADFRRFH